MAEAGHPRFLGMVCACRTSVTGAAIEAAPLTGAPADAVIPPEDEVSDIAVTAAPGRAERGAARIHSDRIGAGTDPDVRAPVPDAGDRRYFPQRAGVSGGGAATA